LAGVPAPAKRETENEFFHVRWLSFCLFLFFLLDFFACSFFFALLPPSFFYSPPSFVGAPPCWLDFLLLPCRENKKTE
jgi:hypothetical protein